MMMYATDFWKLHYLSKRWQLLVGSRAGAVTHQDEPLSVSGVSPFVPG
jgi:hypothetical protein